MKHCVVCLVFKNDSKSFSAVSLYSKSHLLVLGPKICFNSYFSKVNLLDLILSERKEFLLYQPSKTKFLTGVKIFFKYAILTK